MPDEHIRAAVREALGLAPDASLTPSRLEKLTEFRAVQPKMMIPQRVRVCNEIGGVNSLVGVELWI